MNILDTIAENTRQRYKEIIKNKPLAKVKAEALEMPKGNFEFEKALGGDTLSFICEVKKASPSKGVIAEDFPYLQIAKEYEAAGARIIGVNNRNLKDFSVDVNNSTRYRDMIPKNVLFVSESGIKTHSDIKVLQNNKTDAVLIGETFMKSENKKKMLEELLYG